MLPGRLACEDVSYCVLSLSGVGVTDHDALFGRKVETLDDHGEVDCATGAIFWVLHRADEALRVPLEGPASDGEETAECIVRVGGEWTLLHDLGYETTAHENRTHLLGADHHHPEDFLRFDNAICLPGGAVDDFVRVKRGCVCWEWIS